MRLIDQDCTLNMKINTLFCYMDLARLTNINKTMLYRTQHTVLCLLLFLPRDAMHSAGRRLCRRKMSVRLSVCHTPVFCHVTPCHFFHKIRMALFRRDHPSEGIECAGYEKWRFSTNISLYLGDSDIMQDRAIITMADQ